MSPVAVALIGVFVGFCGATIAPLLGLVGDRFRRTDEVKRYKRIIYRNFLAHAYWYRTLQSGEEKDGHHRDYVADWYRIQLLTTNAGILDQIAPLREDIEAVARVEEDLLKAFTAEIGEGGLGD